jgi:hypothetical protein
MQQKKFEYKKRNADQIKKRAAQAGGRRDGIVKDDFKVFTPKDKDNRLRFLPPTWESSEHYGFDIYVHYGIGPDNGQYLCLAKMKNSMCPICEERHRAESEKLTDYAKELNPVKRVLIWLIDRDQEDDGPKIWAMPWTIDRDISKLSVEEKGAQAGSFLPIDDPDEGYDVEFERKGKGIQTEFIGLRIARRASSLGNQTWLDYVVEHPLPSCLNFQEYEYIQNVFNAKPVPKDATTTEKDSKESKPENSQSNSSSKTSSFEQATSLPESNPKLDFTFEQISSLEKDDLVELALEYKMITPVESKILSIEQLFIRICSKGGIVIPGKEEKKEEPKKEESKKLSYKDKLKKIKEEEGV